MSTTRLVTIFVSCVLDAVVLAIITLVREAALRLDAIGSNTRSIRPNSVGRFEVVRETFSGNVAVQSEDLGVSVS